MSKNSFETSQVLAGCIEIYDDVIDNCAEIIEITEKRNEWSSAEVYVDENSDKTEILKDVRSNSTLKLNQFSYETEEEIYLMCRKVWQYCNEYAQKYSFSFYETEVFQILKYEPGEYYDPHYDAARNIPRICSALLYLNDVEEGGETEFINFDVSVKPKAGRLVIFPSNYAYTHAARLPKNGTKYVAVFWMRG